MMTIKKIAFFSFAMMIFAVAANAQLPGQTTSPTERKILKRILALPYYGVFDHITFTMDGGTVVLSGQIADARNLRDAEIAVRDIDGVTSVVNRIEVLPPSGFDDSIRRQMLRTFSRDGGSFSGYLLEPRPAVRIIVKNGHVTLEGNVTYKGDSQLAYILANGVPGVFSVTNNLKVGRLLNP